jgi:hypothetical protein
MMPFFAPEKHHVFKNKHQKTVGLNPIFSFKSIILLDLQEFEGLLI